MSHIQIAPSPATRDVCDNLVNDLFDADSGEWLGRIAHVGGKTLQGKYPQAEGWRIVTCGPLVPFPASERFEDQHQAAEAAAKARETDTRHHRDETGLTPYERDILDFEAHFAFPHEDGSRTRAIAELLDTTRTEHYGRLARLITGPNAQAALRYQPELVKRLKQRMANRQKVRTRYRCS